MVYTYSFLVTDLVSIWWTSGGHFEQDVVSMAKLPVFTAREHPLTAEHGVCACVIAVSLSIVRHQSD